MGFNPCAVATELTLVVAVGTKDHACPIGMGDPLGLLYGLRTPPLPRLQGAIPGRPECRLEILGIV